MLRYRPPVAVTIAACLAVFAMAAGGAAAAGLLTGKDIKNNSLRSVDIRNHSLLKKDFRKGQLPRGARGAAGPAGKPGAGGTTGATGPSGISGLVYVSGGDPEDTVDDGAVYIDVDNKGTVQANCPSGSYPISGTLVSAEGGISGLSITGSEPTFDGQRVPTGWRISAYNEGTEASSIRVLAACVPSGQVPVLPPPPEVPK